MAQMIVARTRPAYQAYQLLYLGFIVAPLVAGLDTFTHVGLMLGVLALARLSEEFAEGAA
jgi:hypothetical protein